MPAFSLNIPSSKGASSTTSDLSQTGDLKTFIYTGGQKELIEVQYSANNSAPWVKVMQFGGSNTQMTTHQVPGGFFRVNRAAVDSGTTPLVSIIAMALHPTQTFSLNIPSTTGPGTSTDLSQTGNSKTILYSGGSGEALQVECSADGNAPWGAVAVFGASPRSTISSGGLTAGTTIVDESVFTFPTGFLRVNRLHVDKAVTPVVTVAVGPAQPPVATAPSVTTTTTTTTQLAEYPTYADGVFDILANVIQRRPSTAFGGIYLHAVFKRVSGTVSQVGTTQTLNSIQDSGLSGSSAAFAVSGSNILLNAVGLAGVTINWRANLTVTQLSP